MSEVVKKKMGFAVMNPEVRKRIASLGGKAAHRQGVAYQWDAKAAAEAGRIGGRVSRGGRGRLPVVEPVLRSKHYPS